MHTTVTVERSHSGNQEAREFKGGHIDERSALSKSHTAAASIAGGLRRIPIQRRSTAFSLRRRPASDVVAGIIIRRVALWTYNYSAETTTAADNAASSAS